MTPHKHAALMMQYAQDWAETDEPWERWEVAAFGNKFVPLHVHPGWREEHEYRRKPHMMTYTVTMPKPIQKAPDIGAVVYIPTPLAEELASMYGWYGVPQDNRLLKRGLCFATEEDAIAAAKAMLPFKQEEA